MMKLEQIWEMSKKPDYDYFQGNFEVKILTGIFKPLNWNYKQWDKDIKELVGYNIQDGEIAGYFKKWFTNDGCLLNYNLSQNNNFWNRLNDHIRQLTPNIFLGKIYFNFLGKYRFLGYFTLTRKEK